MRRGGVGRSRLGVPWEGESWMGPSSLGDSGNQLEFKKRGKQHRGGLERLARLGAKKVSIWKTEQGMRRKTETGQGGARIWKHRAKCQNNHTK